MSVVGARRLQVFVSSTYKDLKLERQAAVEAILKMGHIPAGMELFAADNRKQMETIKDWIMESDIYLLIVGGRYGSVEPDSGKSFTHLEWEFAQSESKPSFTCMLDSTYITLKQLELERQEKGRGAEVRDIEECDHFTQWKRDLLGTLVEQAKDINEIKLAVHSSIPVLERLHESELRGWVRPNPADFAGISDAMAMLTKENQRLRLELAVNDKSAQIGGLNFRQAFDEIAKDADMQPLLSCSALFVRPIAVTRNVEVSRMLQKLTVRGLLFRNSDKNRYELSENGKQFLSWLEFQRETLPETTTFSRIRRKSADFVEFSENV